MSFGEFLLHHPVGPKVPDQDEAPDRAAVLSDQTVTQIKYVHGVLPRSPTGGYARGRRRDFRAFEGVDALAIDKPRPFPAREPGCPIVALK